MPVWNVPASGHQRFEDVCDPGSGVGFATAQRTRRPLTNQLAAVFLRYERLRFPSS